MGLQVDYKHNGENIIYTIEGINDETETTYANNKLQVQIPCEVKELAVDEIKAIRKGHKDIIINDIIFAEVGLCEKGKYVNLFVNHNYVNVMRGKNKVSFSVSSKALESIVSDNIVWPEFDSKKTVWVKYNPESDLRCSVMETIKRILELGNFNPVFEQSNEVSSWELKKKLPDEVSVTGIKNLLGLT